MGILAPLKVSDEDRTVLQRWVRGHSTEQRLVRRARIVLAAAVGQTNRAIAAAMGLSENSVGNGVIATPSRDWRVLATGRGPVGRRSMTMTTGWRWSNRSLQTPPDPASHQTLAALQTALADTVGMSASRIREVLHELDLETLADQVVADLPRPRLVGQGRRRLRPVPGPTRKCGGAQRGREDLHPGESAYQSHETARPGHVERREFEYRRAGTTCLFAALDVHSGQIVHEAKDRNRCEDFVAFPQRLDEATPAGLTLHVVVDNGSSQHA